MTEPADPGNAQPVVEHPPQPAPQPAPQWDTSAFDRLGEQIASLPEQIVRAIREATQPAKQPPKPPREPAPAKTEPVGATDNTPPKDQTTPGRQSWIDWWGVSHNG